MAKIAVITGANRGLGYATARELGRAGVHVVVGARDAARGEAAAARLVAEGLSAESLTLDVASTASVRAAAERLQERHARVDVLVNNAGILPEATAAGAEQPLDAELFRATFETNVFGPVLVTQALLPLLRASAAGHIVNVSSRMGSLSDQTDPSSPYHGLVVPAYQMSKAALNGLTVALAKSLADTDVRATSVCPGWVQTDLGGPENRAAAPIPAEEAAQLVAEVALLDGDAPSGRFVDRDGTVAW